VALMKNPTNLLQDRQSPDYDSNWVHPTAVITTMQKFSLQKVRDNHINHSLLCSDQARRIIKTVLIYTTTSNRINTTEQNIYHNEAVSVIRNVRYNK